MKSFINIDKSDYINTINLFLGLYYPLKGFCTFNEYTEISTLKKLNKINFTIPINLFCSKIKASKVKIGDSIILKYKNDIIGYLFLKSVFTVNKKDYIKSIFGTNDLNHLGVNNYNKKINKAPISLGGDIFLLKSKVKKYFKYDNLINIKKIKKNNKRDVAFSTRNIPHIGHNLIQQNILKRKKNLSIFLILGIKNKYNEKILINSYKSLKKNKIFKNLNLFFIYLPSFFAGPNEAFFQAKIFENLKYNYFYVGRDHAGYKFYYNKFESQSIFNKLKTKIKIIKLNEPVICNKCEYVFFNKFKKICPNCSNNDLLELNGSDIKILIKRKKTKLLSKFLDPSIFNFLKKTNFSLQDV